MHDDIANAFDCVKDHISIACEYLEDLITAYQHSDLPERTKSARYAAIRAKQDYLKGLQFNSSAHPWVED